MKQDQKSLLVKGKKAISQMLPKKDNGKIEAITTAFGGTA